MASNPRLSQYVVRKTVENGTQMTSQRARSIFPSYDQRHAFRLGLIAVEAAREARRLVKTGETSRRVLQAQVDRLQYLDETARNLSVDGDGVRSRCHHALSVCARRVRCRYRAVPASPAMHEASIRTTRAMRSAVAGATLEDPKLEPFRDLGVSCGEIEAAFRPSPETCARWGCHLIQACRRIGHIANDIIGRLGESENVIPPISRATEHHLRWAMMGAFTLWALPRDLVAHELLTRVVGAIIETLAPECGYLQPTAEPVVLRQFGLFGLPHAILDADYHRMVLNKHETLVAQAFLAYSQEPLSPKRMADYHGFSLDKNALSPELKAHLGQWLDGYNGRGGAPRLDTDPFQAGRTGKRVPLSMQPEHPNKARAVAASKGSL